MLVVGCICGLGGGTLVVNLGDSFVQRRGSFVLVLGCFVCFLGAVMCLFCSASRAGCIACGDGYAVDKSSMALVELI
jgi:hypothetical protein